MKKTSIKILILAATLSLSYSSCQKDTVDVNTSENVSLTDNSQFHLIYFVNGNPSVVELANSTALQQLIQNLDILAIEGYSISVRNQRAPSSGLAAKDVVEFETKDRKEFENWLEKMVFEGYGVAWEYDKETGTFRGTAIKD